MENRLFSTCFHAFGKSVEKTTPTGSRNKATPISATIQKPNNGDSTTTIIAHTAILISSFISHSRGANPYPPGRAALASSNHFNFSLENPLSADFYLPKDTSIAFQRSRLLHGAPKSASQTRHLTSLRGSNQSCSRTRNSSTSALGITNAYQFIAIDVALQNILRFLHSQTANAFEALVMAENGLIVRHFEKLVAVFARQFGLVHSLVGLAQQLVGVERLGLRVEGDTQTGRHP